MGIRLVYNLTQTFFILSFFIRDNLGLYTEYKNMSI